MVDEAFLTGLIGQRTSDTTVVVERGPASTFARSVLDHSPLYRDAAAAAEAGFAAIPVAPTFPFVMAHWGAFPEIQASAQEREGTLEGGVQSILDTLLEDGGLILHGEQSFHFYRPVVVGDVLHGVGSIVDAYQKESNGRTMSFIVEEQAWSDTTSGEPVVDVRFNVIYRK
jgi:acyl dehydratase